MCVQGGFLKETTLELGERRGEKGLTPARKHSMGTGWGGKGVLGQREQGGGQRGRLRSSAQVKIQEVWVQNALPSSP